MTLEPAEALLLRSWRASTRIAALPEAVRPANRAGGYSHPIAPAQRRQAVGRARLAPLPFPCAR